MNTLTILFLLAQAASNVHGVVSAPAPGYAAAEKVVTVPASGAARVMFTLDPEPLELSAITVEAEASVDVSAPTGPPPIRLEAATVKE